MNCVGVSRKSKVATVPFGCFESIFNSIIQVGDKQQLKQDEFMYLHGRLQPNTCLFSLCSELYKHKLQ